MANLKDIKNRIQSVKSTQKITRAMKMVAAAKVKKAENTVKASRPFTQELTSMFKKLLDNVGTFSSSTLKIKTAVDNYPELLQIREVKTVGLLVITSNKGLAGAYNANVVRMAVKTVEEYHSKGIKTLLFVVGQKGIAALKRRCKDYNCTIEKTYLGITFLFLWQEKSLMQTCIVLVNCRKRFMMDLKRVKKLISMMIIMIHQQEAGC